MTFSVNWMGWISEKMPMTVCVRNTQLAQEIAKKELIGLVGLFYQFSLLFPSAVKVNVDGCAIMKTLAISK